MNNQVFLYGLKLNFNLREPYKNKETPIYAVIRLNGKQYKIPTGVKVYPLHWNRKQQMAIINKSLSNIEIRNNNIVNKRIIELKFAFEDFKLYICENYSFGDIKNIIYRFLNMKRKVKKENLYATALLNIAFKSYYANSKESVIKANDSRLKIIRKWIEKNTSNDNNILNQRLLNRFIKSEKERNIGVSQINSTCGLLARLINHLTQDEEYCDFVEPVKYIRVQDLRNRREEEYKSKKVELKDEEIQAIKSVNLDEELEEYRDILLLQINVGLRVSDINQLFELDVDINNIINVDTLKEGVTACVRYENAKQIVEKYKKSPFKYIKFNSSFYQKYNNNIKFIAKKAELNRIIKYYDPKDLTATKLIEEPLFEALSTHYARHTFATKELRKHSPESVALQTGHKTIKSLGTYNHVQKEEKINNMLNEYNDNEAENKLIKEHNKKGKIEIVEEIRSSLDENKEVLLMLGANAYKVWDIKDNEEARTLLSEYEHKIMNEIGSDKLKPIKDIFNEKLSLEERIEMINKLKLKKHDTN